MAGSAVKGFFTHLSGRLIITLLYTLLIKQCLPSIAPLRAEFASATAPEEDLKCVIIRRTTQLRERAAQEEAKLSVTATKLYCLDQAWHREMILSYR